MKLYSAAHSPYSSRARLAIYSKNLPVEIAAPPGGGSTSPEWLAINPIGKIPALVLNDGTVIPESEIIVEFFADAFPESDLRPTHPVDIARARLLSRIVDLYLLPHGQPLIAQFDPRTRDASVVETALAQIDKGMAHLNAFMTDDAYEVGDRLTTADCALVTVLFYMDVFSQAFEKKELVARHAKVASYWSRVRQDPYVRKVLGEMQEGLISHSRGG